MSDEFQATQRPKKFQFSLGLLLGASLYAAALATLCVNFAGKNWAPIQIAAAYMVTILCVVSFAIMSKARGKIAVYLLISPLIFVASVVSASLFQEMKNRSDAGPKNGNLATTVPAPTTAGAGPSAPSAPFIRPPQSSPGSKTPLEQ